MYRRNFLRYLSTSCGSKNQKPLNVTDKFEKIVDKGTGKRSKVQVRFFSTLFYIKWRTGRFL